MGEPNDDPYQIKNLSVQYDYLMYKIRDHVQSLSETTFKSVVAKKASIETDVFQQQLMLDTELAEADNLLEQFRELELLFLKLEQLYTFVEDFSQRVHLLESSFAKIGG